MLIIDISITRGKLAVLALAAALGASAVCGCSAQAPSVQSGADGTSSSAAAESSPSGQESQAAAAAPQIDESVYYTFDASNVYYLRAECHA